MPTADFFHRYLYSLAEIHASFDLEATQNAVVRNAVMLDDARGASLMLFNAGEENLIASATFGLSDAYRAKGTISPRKSLGETIDGAPVTGRVQPARRCARSGRVVIENQVSFEGE